MLDTDLLDEAAHSSDLFFSHLQKRVTQ